MLSVLIPVYNYDVRALVTRLHKQLALAAIRFEIICIDDFSDPEMSQINAEIVQLPHTTYEISNRNAGCDATRQTLAIWANYDWLIFLDADVMPVSEDFISNYLKFTTSEYDAIYGGITYKPEKPESNLMLRWEYGNAKENVPASARNRKPYKMLVTANFMIRKTIFLKLNSKIEYKGYGYDIYLGALLKSNSFKVFHIDNEVYHLGLEPNATYLNKVEEAVDNLLKLNQEGKLKKTENSLLNTFERLKYCKLNHYVAWTFRRSKKQLTINLLSARPNITLLQYYKLGYICEQDLKL
ncbi:glycosyltransferase family 2 protein [Subsaximicrobium wynnwilliamsii]|uniref:Glycosyltransferase family 2 protein n=1 Tax=Subsaximicrobium wynnwilliamsii TaxID=291179 RepID=A0A5C6ZKH6_9FLAO|nr:glycosyltransferase [Subsaximicrobium wynnwilliamsii]TXD83339.1 glycosyltransferase family 2 protein [Subsaximicrobium wynnwilliamsii]TXD89124.1 glycosyltransferase family 2 protein [Subsaximicrobium wynnwilliamsii]TXE03363.1 glycosyltransferase family 2 protein [Subsaximicrobium wynnwilliamsii]